MPTLTEPPSRLSTASHWTEHVQQLSQRLIAAQRPIRFQDALAWDPQIEHQFLSAGGAELPRVDRDYYRTKKLTFDPARKQEELQDIERDAQRLLGQSGVGAILVRMCRETVGQVRLLTYRGTRTFTQISQRLYGSALACDTETWLATLNELERRFPAHTPSNGRYWTADEAADELLRRLRPCFPGWETLPVVAVEVDSGVRPACDALKLQRSRGYQERDIRYLEVHDGWVGLGTTFNALTQAVCEFLTLPAARASGTQAGLATLVAFVAGVMTNERIQSRRRRIEAIQMAESGADFCDVYRFFRGSSADQRECYRRTHRVFAGSLPKGCGPLTKDLGAAAGLTAVWSRLQSDPEALRLLFAGKIAIEDLAILQGLYNDGWLTPPVFLPPIRLC